MIKAVVFDLDDTLISEEDYIKSGYRHIAKIIADEFKLAYEDIFEDLMKLYLTNREKVFNRLFDLYSIKYSTDDILFLVSEYRAHLPQISFFDDVIPFLEFLKANSIKTGIITDGYKISQRNKLLALGAYKYFDEIIITDELGRKYWKPHKKAYELIKMKLNIQYNEMLYIGDNPEKDFYISSIFPIKCVRIRRANGLYTHNNYFHNHTEYCEIQSLNQLYKEIEKFKTSSIQQ